MKMTVIILGLILSASSSLASRGDGFTCQLTSGYTRNYLMFVDWNRDVNTYNIRVYSKNGIFTPNDRNMKPFFTADDLKVTFIQRGSQVQVDGQFYMTETTQVVEDANVQGGDYSMASGTKVANVRILEKGKWKNLVMSCNR